ncbi:MAG: lipid IV(A) 3-deoxy-D-manno-octulosonic acid transferase [Campylobacteraceae bacterium]|jgi:3-deoxy-D-manno-octulosonic-acid transferase|nr:lipid IV(A) 3-deoxy-D-manno-octulosonic acid transferase [Campylobacteraceae bacterium]
MKLLFICFYYALLSLFYIAALPASFVICCFKKYRRAVPSRFFLYKNMPFPKKGGIWLHACSYGEVASLSPLIHALGNDRVNISVITKTGFDKACQICESKNVRFLPYEIFLPFWINEQKTLVVTEAELWLMLFFIARKRGMKTMLINARISDNSYHKYKRFKWFYKIIFSFVDEVHAQSETDKKRLASLGAQNIKVSGNIKSSLLPKVTRQYKINNIYKRVITLASTHIGEEAPLLEQLSCIDLSNTLIVVAPRHPERFEAVHKLLQSWANSNGKICGKLSKEGLEEQNDIVLCDTMGELVNIYAITDITILGGSFMDGIGGHNPLEPAAFNNSIISGRFFFNQKELYAKIEGIVICDIKEVGEKLKGALPKTSTAYLEKTNDIVKSILSAQTRID